jgi:hypothetical protein
MYILVKKIGKGGKPLSDSNIKTTTKNVPIDEELKPFKKENKIKRIEE